MQNSLKNMKQYWHRSWVKGIVATFLILFAIYGVVGFFVIPDIIQTKAQEFVSDKFQRKLIFKEIRLNPFTLRADFEEMQLSEPNQESNFASFSHLTVDFSIQSLFRIAPVISEVKLTNPKVHISRSKSNHYNFNDILAFVMVPKEDDSPARFAINNIQIENGVIEFDDQPQQKKHLIDELKLDIPFISSIPSQVDILVDLALSARVNKEKIELVGKARPFLKDKDGKIRIKLDKIHLPTYIGYLPFNPHFKLADGKLSTDLEIDFAQTEKNGMGLSIEGKVILNSFSLNETNDVKIVKIPELEIDIGKSNVFSGKIEINHVQLTHPEVYLDRNKNGQWNFERLLPLEEKVKKKNQSLLNKKQDENIPFSITLKNFSIKEGQLQIQDQIHVVPSHFSVKDFGLNVDGITLNVSKQDVNIEKITSTGTDIQFIHGELKLSNNEKEEVARETIRKTANEVGNQTGYQFLVNHFELRDWSIQFENQDAKKRIKTQISKLEMSADHISNYTKQPIQLSIHAKVNQKGIIAIKGDVDLSPLKADLDLSLKDIDIRAIQPYIKDYVNLSLRQADLSVQGKLQISQSRNQSIQGQFNGDAGISRMVTVDQLTRRPFVSWKDLAFKGIHLEIEPLSLVVDEVRLNNLLARVILSAQGRLNLQNILQSETGGQKSLIENEDKNSKVLSSNNGLAIQQPESGKNTAVEKEKIKKNYSIQIKKWFIQNGKVLFSDNFIRPHYTANLIDLRGIISNLSTNPESQAKVRVNGQVNGAPLVIVGFVNPLSDKLMLDISAKVKGMELAQFSAYSGKYVGYGIEKGKLSFDVKYKIQDQQLTAENALILDQLTLGEKVESESATHLPVQLALSLLKDKDGIIDINLPVGGSLNDPEFSVGGIIVKVVINLLQKAVTAPFSFLSSLAGHDEELSVLIFEPGTYNISGKEQKKLESLATALEKRPGLKLEIAGKYDVVVDKEGLGRLAIQRKVREQKRQELEEKASADEIIVSAKEYPDLLKQVYKNEKFDKPKKWGILNKSLSVPEMEGLLIKHFSLTNTELVQLANRRAETVKSWLIQTGKIPEERIFLLASTKGKLEEDTPANRVDFSLH